MRPTLFFRHAALFGGGVLFCVSACDDAASVALNAQDAAPRADQGPLRDGPALDANARDAAPPPVPDEDASPTVDGAPPVEDAAPPVGDGPLPAGDAAPPAGDAVLPAGDAAPPVVDAHVSPQPEAGPADAAAAPTPDELLAACDADPLLAGRLVTNVAGWGHVPEGTVVEYTNNPPASGPHYGQWVRSGIYEEPIDRRNWVHNVEHGWLVLLHRPDAPAAVVDALHTAYVEAFDDAACPMGPVRRILVTPDPLLETPVAAVTAYRALSADRLDRPVLERMFTLCREAAPERRVCADGRVPVPPSMAP